MTCISQTCEHRLRAVQLAGQVADLLMELDNIHTKLDRAGVPRLSKEQDAGDRIYHALLSPRDSIYVKRVSP